MLFTVNKPTFCQSVRSISISPYHVLILLLLQSPFIRIILDAKPRIVRETTRTSKLAIISNAIESLRYYFTLLKCGNKNTCSVTTEAAFDDLILPGELKESILDLSCSVSSSRKNNTPFRHVILHGPDGVGKKMAAKKIADCAGVDYARICGRDVITTGEEAVSQIQTLFTWAKTSSNDMLLYIDEAEAFLGSTGSPLMSEYMDPNHQVVDKQSDKRSALSTFLLNMSNLRRGIILVLATKSDQDLDREVLDHFEERIFFPLPDSSRRKELILLYFDLCVRKFVERSNANAVSFKSKLVRFITRESVAVLSIEDDLMMSNEQLEEVIAATRGLSGADICQLMSAMAKKSVAHLDLAAAWKLIEARVKSRLDSETLTGEHTNSYLDGDIVDLQDVTFV